MNKNKNVYPDFPGIGTFNADGDTADIHNYKCHIGDSHVAAVFIFSQDFESWKAVIFLTVPGDNISASAHKVKITLVKCAVVRVAHSPTHSNWFLHTGGEGTHYLALFILTTANAEARARHNYNKWRKQKIHMMLKWQSWAIKRLLW